MKNIILCLMLAFASTSSWAQADTQGNVPDSTAKKEETINDSGEDGGVSPEKAQPDSGGYDWMFLALGAIALVVVTAVATRALTKGKKEPVPVIDEEPEEVVAEPKAKDSKASAAELRKLKAELKVLNNQVQELQNTNASLDRNLEIYRNFDSGYFSEAFRKLVMPLNEAMEKGSEREVLENMVKIMGHFSSLTRYKISKKQPYDEANIHYMLNQKTSNDVAVDITGDTPLDKTPKNIKTILDLLKQQQSRGLDDSIIAGYKIKNL
ncbi:MAG: hypothetical protein EOP49_11990 [Sphingobacteriales bacterium]|nr:MAG: hypothetical protein EOP49_11990 [Sphingobacteriales bacterium]